MGKDLKGKELGKGIVQLSSKKYRVRIYKNGRVADEKTFDVLSEAKKWKMNRTYEMENDIPATVDKEKSKMTVDKLLKKWIKQRSRQLKINTIRNYWERYVFNIKDELGGMLMTEVTSEDCQGVLDKMVEDYATSTIELTFDTMRSFFYYAYDKGYTKEYIMNKNDVIIPKGEGSKKIDFFSIEEQSMFLKIAKDYAYYEQFALMLYTGIRISELIGLKWENVNLDKGVIYINTILEYRYSRTLPDDIYKKDKLREDGWHFGTPKTECSVRTVYLCKPAIELLRKLQNRPYLQDSTPEEFRDLVFLGKRNGLPVKNNTYDNALRKLIDIMTDELNDKRRKQGLELIKPHYLSCHDLRHTYATRYLESMSIANIAKAYKALSESLGHKSTSITMDIYAHITDDSYDELNSEYENYMKRLFAV